MALLDVSNLTVSFSTPRGVLEAVKGVSFSVEPGRCLGIVGESGSGKSQTMLGLLGLLPQNGTASGSALFEGEELIGAPRRRLDQLRGSRMSLVFQDSITGLTPHMRIGDQLAEVLQVHGGLSRKQALADSQAMLEVVRLSEPERRMRQYPHELSGGMRQRVMIAMALLCKPSLLVADEPTTALDVTVQATILSALNKLKQHARTAIILITHDLGVVAGVCDDVAVMYGGRIVEQAPADELFANPAHPYTRGLLACTPRIDLPGGDMLPAIPGTPPPLNRMPPGCAFAPRCAVADPGCTTVRPEPRQSGTGMVSCLKATA
jgi:oligopeptide transport system ATP-binding protein